MRRNALATMALALCGAAPGCSTLGPAAASAQAEPAPGAAYSYGGGRASQEFPFPLPAVQAALASALEDLRIPSQARRDPGGALIYQGATADGRPATVTVRPNSGGTRLGVRIGWFRDEPLSRALMDRVGVRLGTLPPAAIPVDPPSEPAPNPYFSRSAVSDAEMLQGRADAPYRGGPEFP